MSLENNRLTMQMRGELVISRRELQVTRREADQANRAAQEKQALETGVAALQEIHARVARGDLSARAPAVLGPLLPIAISLNLMLDRLRALAQRGAAYEQLIFESRLLQAALDRLGQGLPPWPADQPAPRSTTELRPAFLGLTRLQHLQENQRHRLTRELESMSALTQRLGAALAEVMEADLFKEQALASYERMALQRVIGAATLLEQRLTALLRQTHAATPGLEQPSNQAYPADQGAQPAWQGRQSYYQPGVPKPYTNRTYQTPPFGGRSGEEYQD